ncbi:acetolactate synthase AlsS [Francisella sp. Scap27]|uniref:acetolactate synthase AlsS n=1 Tax=Francisella sp. Scap27 TaxID=2589986 RepID=UPI0015BF947E|nr:acetolactate synthase AlsS [Francisella sp. Scap27]QLE79588.1 acetolactate synthase AlsS [Francisella sp. Scap27]
MQTAAQLVVKCLEENDVEYVFGIPGAKIDTVFDALHDSKIKLILCRHEQNATFMAAAYGRTTGKPGVVLVTSGPGVGNLVTGLLTATTEGDPVVALGGNVALSMKFRETHQNADNSKLLESVTKSSIEVTNAEIIPEAIANAFRISTEPKSGGCFISLPQDILQQLTAISPCKKSEAINFGRASEQNISNAIKVIESAQSPVLFLGQEASRSENANEIAKLVNKLKIPVISTYQGAGVIPRNLIEYFYGRVGLFKNQPGDKVLAQADLVITVGLNLFEYDAEVWNSDANKQIIHVDYKPANIHYHYQPECEILGNIYENIKLLTERLSKVKSIAYPDLQNQLFDMIKAGVNKQGKNNRIHPLRFVNELNKVIDDDTIICCDIGSVYMWLARYLISHKPHQLLFSNGQQTLGVALPWAMAVKLANPNKKVISISGDGGFLFSAMELETAIRENIKITHFVWQDGSYDMVKEQELMKYKRGSGVDLGQIDIPKFASAFGADGYQTNNPEDIVKLYNKSLSSDKPTLINVSMDYSDNMELFLQVQDTGVGH